MDGCYAVNAIDDVGDAVTGYADTVEQAQVYAAGAAERFEKGKTESPSEPAPAEFGSYDSRTKETSADCRTPAFDARAFTERKERERQIYDSPVAWGDTRMVVDPEQDQLAKERGEAARVQDAVEAELRRRRKG